MNTLDKQYQDLLKTIIEHGVIKKDRTGTGTISIFGYTIRHNMKNGFPLLTTKKMPWKTIVTELLWFLRGDTNIKYLVDNGCNIWNGDAYKRYETEVKRSIDKATADGILNDDGSEGYSILSPEGFTNRIKTDPDFAKKWGELGPTYGAQWRAWGGYEQVPNGWEHGAITQYAEVPKNDQIAKLIHDLKTNPDSRRLMVNAWNVGELDQMVLPPCHYGFQVYTRELSLNDRILEFVNRDLDPSEFRRGGNYGTVIPKEKTLEVLDKHNIPTRAISLMWNQRSVDTFLGLPFNIASYGLLLEIIAKEVNMVPDELIGNLGDVHLYLNHIEQAKEQIGREYTPEERADLLKDAMSWRLYNKAVNELMPFGGGMSEYYEAHKIPKLTREPYPLPTIKLADEVKWAEGDCLPTYSISDIVLENYQSHPAIKAPLSN